MLFWLGQNSSILTWGIVEFCLALCNRTAYVQFLLCMDEWDGKGRILLNETGSDSTVQ